MKETKKGSGAIFVLVLLSMTLVLVIGFMYYEMKNTREEINELNEKISNLEQSKEEVEDEKND